VTEIPGSVDGWPDQNLLATAHAHFGEGADSDLPEWLRFLIGVVRIIGNRRRQATEPEQTPAVFFLAPTGPASLAATELRSEPLLDNGLSELGGQLWFVGPVPHNGLALALPEWPSDAELFDRIEGELAIGDLPAVLFDPRPDPPQLRHYPAGLADRDRVVVIATAGQPIDLDRVLEVLDVAHRAHLEKPRSHPEPARLWQNGAKHRPKSDAEARIQFILRIALQAAFPATVVREEQPQTSGRLDLEIDEAVPPAGTFIRHALLELKVLRSYTNTGSIVSASTAAEAIEEGLRQAIAYRDERGTLASALCCFDMRKAHSGESCFEPVAQHASEQKVALRVWPLYGTVDQFRRATT
jgi:hypothetical protein